MPDLTAGSIPQRNAFVALKGVMDKFGLGQLGDKIWGFMLWTGADDAESLMLWLQDQPEFQSRFPALAQLRAKGRAISPQQYMDLERTHKQILQQAGVWNWLGGDGEGLVDELIGQEISPSELQARVQDGFVKVAHTDPTVRNAFKQYFGVDGDKALASYFLSSSKSTPQLLKMAQAAQVGGAAAQFGIRADLNLSTRLADMGVDYNQAMKGFNDVARLRDLFEGGVGEAGVNPAIAPTSELTPHKATWYNKPPKVSGAPADLEQFPEMMSKEAVQAELNAAQTDANGVAYVFGTNAETQRDLQRRLQQRLAQFSSANSGVAVDKGGLSSLGRAD